MQALIDNSWVLNTLQVGVPFAAFFVGIVVRKVALPGPNSPRLGSQLLLGVPVSLAIVSPVLTIFAENLRDMPVYLAAVGVIMEHGMLVTETAMKQLQRVLQEGGGAAAEVVPAATRTN